MIKILIVAGTRPELIKIAPILIEAKKNFAENLEVKLCFTGQHRSMAEEVINLFQLNVDYDLDIMKPNQTLNGISKSVFEKLPSVLESYKPDIVLVQGDTTTAALSALCAFNLKILVGHIEAGLRSFNIDAPFPEEANRKIINTFSKFNFVPTKSGKDNLLNENVNEKDIYLVGNTIVDALKIISNSNELANISNISNLIQFPFVLVTAHRRESFGDGFKNICTALKNSALKFPNYQFIYPVHLNPNVKVPVNNILKDVKNILLIEPVSYLSLLTLLKNCKFVLTDSGGIQEEAPSFQKYCIVMRDVTERIESIRNGFAELVGTNQLKIENGIEKQLNNKENIKIYSNPYGDGLASNRILTIIENYFN